MKQKKTVYTPAPKEVARCVPPAPKEFPAGGTHRGTFSPQARCMRDLLHILLFGCVEHGQKIFRRESRNSGIREIFYVSCNDGFRATGHGTYGLHGIFQIVKRQCHRLLKQSGSKIHRRDNICQNLQFPSDIFGRMALLQNICKRRKGDGGDMAVKPPLRAQLQKTRGMKTEWLPGRQDIHENVRVQKYFHGSTPCFSLMA